MKKFQLPNISRAWQSSYDGSAMLSISINYPEDLVDCPLWWQERGLQQTASGYGGRLTSNYKINYQGKLRRIYHSCFGNASSAWFMVKGVKIHVS